MSRPLASICLQLRPLEDRTCPADAANPFTYLPQAMSGPSGIVPADIRHGYGIDLVTFAGAPADGSGQTIALVEAYSAPNLASDLAVFSRQFGLRDPGFVRQVNQAGGTALPGTDINWTFQIARDVEWAHAVAPGANLVVVEAASNLWTDLMTAVDTAKSMTGVTVVALNFYQNYALGTDKALDARLTTPAGHAGVTFVSTAGEGQNSRPAVSPNAVCVGGTTTLFNTDHTIRSEIVSPGAGGGCGGGGQPTPAYQVGIGTPPNRAGRFFPDLSISQDYAVRYAVYNTSTPGSWKGWSAAGGTGVTQVAALVALADQGRALAGLPSLDGPSQTLPMIYQGRGGDFRDITQGTGFSGYAAGSGYDLASGLGTPRADRLLAHLSGFALTQSVAAPVHGQPVTFTVAVSAAPAGATPPTGSVVFRDGATTLATVALVNGLATFTTAGLTTGGHTMGVTYQGDATYAARTATASITVAPAATVAALATSAATVGAGQVVTLTASLTAVAPGAGTPTGTVVFMDGTVVIGTGVLSNGAVRFTTTVLARGRHTLTIRYLGDVDFLSSVSSPLIQSVV